MENRAKTVVRRVRESEVFPRIRDAELKMEEDEKKFILRRLNKRKKTKQKFSQNAALPPIHAAKSSSGQQQNSPHHGNTNFFTRFVLNDDPDNSKFVPFNEVFYPSIFNEDARQCPPHGIDFVWMLGFQHLDEELSKKKIQRSKFKT